MRKFLENLKKCFLSLSVFEWCLWIGSLLLTVGGFIAGYLVSSVISVPSLVGSIFGITAVVFICKGNVFGQFLMIVYTLISSIVALATGNYGVVVMLVCVTLPFTIASCVSWLKKPSDGGATEVKVAKLTPAKYAIVFVCAAAIAVAFYFILQAFHTNLLELNALSVAFCFTASLLMVLRSPYYALAYCCNDATLIVIWTLTCVAGGIETLPSLVCAASFLINDTYGFINWKRLEKKQKSA